MKILDCSTSTILCLLKLDNTEYSNDPKFSDRIGLGKQYRPRWARSQRSSLISARSSLTWNMSVQYDYIISTLRGDNSNSLCVHKLSHVMRKPAFYICQNKGADQLWGYRAAHQRLVFTTKVVQLLYFLSPKFQASSHLLWLYSPVCVGPGRKSWRQVFSWRSSIKET